MRLFLLLFAGAFAGVGLWFCTSLLAARCPARVARSPRPSHARGMLGRVLYAAAFFLLLISPTHKRTEGRAPVWGSEFTSKRRRTTGGDSAETAVG